MIYMNKPQTIIMAKGERTVLTKANNQSYSLRTTVPTGIVKQLDLKSGDSIVWKLIPNGKAFEIAVETGNESKSKIKENKK